MRNRKEIEENYSDELCITATPTYGQNRLILEVLLDIRDLLKRKKKK